MKPSRMFCTLLALACLNLAPVWAQEAAPSKGSQFSKPLNVSIQMALLLKKYPKGGPDMALFIEKLLIANISLAPQVIALVEGANSEQRAALARGVAGAVNSPELKSPEMAETILKKAKSADPLFSAAVASLLAVSPNDISPVSGVVSGAFSPSPVVSPN